MAGYDALLPVNVVTGFLGSGKTTLLRRLLASPHLKNVAVMVNEFGEVGLDHNLLSSVTEGILLLENGCVCCAIRGDLQGALHNLFDQRERGDMPPFDRVVIETSGLADPVPIAYTVLIEPVLQHHFRLGNVITVVDAVNGLSQLDTFPESVKQAAVADRIVITKTDLCDETDVAVLKRRLTELNRGSPIYLAADNIAAELLLIEDAFDNEAKADEVERWLAGAEPDDDPTHHDHTHGVSSFCLLFDRPLDWTAFGIWMTMLLNRHGERVLRVKGMLSVIGMDAPVVINGVQHVVHPPTHLERWPDADRRSRIVFVVRDISRAEIESSLAVFNRLANPRFEETTTDPHAHAAA